VGFRFEDGAAAGAKLLGKAEQKEAGLWYVQRVSLEDAAHKGFRGRLRSSAGGRRAGAGPGAVPASDGALGFGAGGTGPGGPTGAGLETDARGGRAVGGAPGGAGVLAELKARLAGPHQAYGEPIRAMLAWCDNRARAGRT